MRRRGIFFCGFLLVSVLIGPCIAQTLPNHLDPSARDDLPELSSVPALRFLTTPDFPPFNYRGPGGKLIGFHIDLARAICDDLKAVCTIQSWPWDQVADALADNQGDALIGGLALNEINGNRFDFSSIYLVFPARFVMRTDTGIQNVPAGLTAKTVAVRRGSRHEDFLRRYLSGVEIRPFDSELAALNAVKDGKVDAFFGDALRASFWLNVEAGCCSFVGDAYIRSDFFGDGLAIAVPAGQDNVRVAINRALARLKRNGQLDELYLRWFPVSFY